MDPRGQPLLHLHPQLWLLVTDVMDIMGELVMLAKVGADSQGPQALHSVSNNFLVLVCESRSHSVAWAGVKFMAILLPPSP